MKHYKNYIKFIVALALVGFLYGFSNKRNAHRNLQKVTIEFTNGDNLYITHETVNKLLIQNNLNIKNIPKEKLVLNDLENILNTNEMIQRAQVYLTIDGELGAIIQQRKPIARVSKNQTFYIDLEGKIMPLSDAFSARVPLITGTINQNNLTDLHLLTTYIYNDNFLKKNIIGIHQQEQDFELKLRTNDFTIQFGNTQNIHQKFNNFKAFYQKASKDSTINNYKTVNLQFNNQVVCTKK